MKHVIVVKKGLLLAAFAAMVLLGACGGSSQPPASGAGGSAAAAATPTGEELYKKNCVACHQADGGGFANSFPPLAKSDYLADRVKTIGQVLNGSSGEMVVNGKTYNGAMPAQQLNDEEIALVLTYVYTNFGNTGSPVTAAEVKALRDKK